MSTDSLPVFGSTGSRRVMFGSRHYSLPVVERQHQLHQQRQNQQQQHLQSHHYGHNHQLVRPGMPQRYESEEEEVSEGDTPNWEEGFFSTTDAESETSGFESDTNTNVSGHNIRNSINAQVGRKNETDTSTFTLRMPASGLSPDAYSRPTSVYTIKPTTNCGVLSPMPLLSPGHDNSSTLIESDTRTSVLAASTTYDSDPNPYIRHSFYSETFSSDEDPILEAHFLTATPIAYIAPNTKPSLVSVSPPHTESGPARLLKKARKVRPASLVRQTSTSSNRTAITAISKTKSPRSARTTKQDERRRSSHIPAEVSMIPCSSPTSVPAWTPSNERGVSRRNSRTSSVYSVSDNESRQSVTSAVEHKRWPLPPAQAPPGNHQVNPHDIERPESSVQAPNHHPTRPEMFAGDRRPSEPSLPSGYRPQTDSSVPLPTESIGLATSYPKPLIATKVAALDFQTNQRRGSHPFYRAPPPPPTPEDHRHNSYISPSHTPSPVAWGDPFPSPPYSEIDDGRSSRASSSGRPSRERAKSISSIASSSSKFSFAAFDATSVRSMVHRHRRHDNNSSIGSNTTNTSAAPADRSSLRIMMSADACKSTSNLSFFLPSSSGHQSDTATNRPNMYRRSTASPTQQLVRLRNSKWLHETSETVTQVGSKAFSGLGSMLRRKASPF